MKRKLIRTLALALCVLLVFSGAAIASDETTMSVEYVPITGDGFVADTLNGVDALYNLTGPTYYCTELIVRYYKTLYDLDVIFNDGPEVKGNSNYWFEKTDSPQPGDVLYADASARAAGSNHAALVKTVNDGSLTLIEENWSWNGQAGINRTVAWPGCCYTAYTLRSSSGTPSPKLTDGGSAATVIPAEMPAAVVNWAAMGVSSWAMESMEQASVYGLTDGLSSGWSKPITRGQLAKLVLRAVNALSDAGQNGQDAFALGLMENSRLDDSLTRQEAATVFVRLLALLNITPEADSTALSRYTDAKSIASWAQNGVTIATQLGLMGGMSSGKFAPAGNLTLEQTVVILTRLCQSAPDLELAQITPKPATTVQAAAPTVSKSVRSAGELIADDSAVPLMIGGLRAD
jgi:hypothetical protein